jgi:hypothetical protein
MVRSSCLLPSLVDFRLGLHTGWLSKDQIRRQLRLTEHLEQHHRRLLEQLVPVDVAASFRRFPFDRPGAPSPAQRPAIHGRSNADTRRLPPDLASCGIRGR